MKILIINFICLSENKNILFHKDGLITLHDGLLNEIKILDKRDTSIYDSYKINEKIFLYSLQARVYVGRLENDILDKYIIKEDYINFNTYINSKKILICHNPIYIFLLNFNTHFPEIFQKFEIDGVKGKLSYDYFQDEYFYIQSSNYYIQYKLLSKEIKEISRIKIYDVLLSNHFH